MYYGDLCQNKLNKSLKIHKHIESKKIKGGGGGPHINNFM